MEETKEYIITSDSTVGNIEDAIDALLCAKFGKLEFAAMQTMALTDEDSQTIRTFSDGNTTWTISDEMFVTFCDEYFAKKTEMDGKELENITETKRESDMLAKELWENAGYEWPINYEN